MAISSKEQAGEALVRKNQQDAAALGISIPGVGGGGTSSRSSVAINPATRDALNVARNAAAAAGKDTYAGNLKDYATFAASYKPGTPGRATSSSGSSRTDESKLGKDISSLSAPAYTTPTKNTGYLDAYEKTLINLANLDQNSINANYDSENKDTQDLQIRETGAESTKLARIGGYLGDSVSGTGAMLKLAADHRAELASLEAKRLSALSQSRIAFAAKQFDVAAAKVKEAQTAEAETYQRQQDFFDNQRALQTDERTQTNQERDDARSVITNILSNTTGQSFDELDKETQDTLEANATKAGYPLEVIKNMLEKPKAEATRIDQLVKDAAKAGAPPSILSAISGASSFTEAAGIASPYIAKGGGSGSGSGSGGGNDLKLSYIPSSLQGIVARQGASSTYDDLLGAKAPAWFYPIIASVGASDFASLGLAGPVKDPDPNGWISDLIWSNFKKNPQIETFISQANHKILGSQDLSSGFDANIPTTVDVTK